MSVTYNMINGISTTDVYQKTYLLWVMIMQTSMQTIMQRNRKQLSLVKQTTKIVVNKRLTMQSLLLLQNIENYIQTIKKLQYSIGKVHKKLFNKIAKSKTYKKLCENEVGSTKKNYYPTLVKKSFRGATAGRATWYGAMELQEHNCPYTVIHEFAHLCGNMHHDIGFRRDVIKLASMFISKEFGNILKKSFKDAKLKVTTSNHILSPEEWIKSVFRMKEIRERKM